jgi:hypothetical protein
MVSALVLCILSSQGVALSKSTSPAKGRKITMAAARKLPLEREAGTVKSGERETEKGKLIYSFDVQIADGIHEVNVKAYSGEILEDHIESAADEAKRKGEKKDQPGSEIALARKVLVGADDSVEVKRARTDRRR